ncbi:MAG: response regulator [Pseudomonadota bacterium]
MFGNTTKRLLAVDDDVASAELIVRVAERFQYEAFATSDSRGVMNLASALSPDVIVIDIRMPNLDADDLLVLLADAGYQGQIMVVSGQEQSILQRTQQHAVTLGLREPFVLQKPVDMGMLRQCLLACREQKAAA